MGHMGHGSVHWWVRWVMGHEIWSIVSSAHDISTHCLLWCVIARNFWHRTSL